MDWLGLSLGLLKLVNLILDWSRHEQYKQEGRDEEIAKQAAAIMQKTEAGKKILERVNALNEAEVDAGLRNLEPG